MCSLLRGRKEADISEDVHFLRTQYNEDDTRTQEDSCFDKVAATLLHSSPEQAVSLRFWRAVHHCGLSSFLDTSIIPSVTFLLTSYDSGHFNGKTQLQLLAVAYGRVLAELQHHGQRQSLEQKHGLEQFIVEAIILGFDVHGGFKNHSPLMVMLTTVCCFWDQGDMVPQTVLQKALHAWLKLFERAGVKLSEYGKEEMCRFELHSFSHTPGSMVRDWYHGVLEDISWWTGPGTMFPLGLTCGHSFCDWNIVLLGFVEECLRDFWQLIEAQIREASYRKYVPPGGWIEDGGILSL
jgi:hypothetical protein